MKRLQLFIIGTISATALWGCESTSLSQSGNFTLMRDMNFIGAKGDETVISLNALSGGSVATIADSGGSVVLAVDSKEIPLNISSQVMADEIRSESKISHLAKDTKQNFDVEGGAVAHITLGTQEKVSELCEDKVSHKEMTYQNQIVSKNLELAFMDSERQEPIGIFISELSHDENKILVSEGICQMDPAPALPPTSAPSEDPSVPVASDPSHSLPGREDPSRQLPGRALPGRQDPSRNLPGRQLPGRTLAKKTAAWW